MTIRTSPKRDPQALPASTGRELGVSTLRFSIITVCYNEQETIAKTLDSILEQSCGNIELVVVDGGSSDGTIVAVRPYLSRIAHFVSEPDRGLYDAMNKGLALVRGDYVCFMNAGDRFADSEALERVAAATTNRTLCLFGRALIEGDGVCYENPPAGTIITAWLGRGIPSHQVTFYPRAFAMAHRYDLDIGSVADTDYTLRAFKECGFDFLDTLVAVFRMGGISNRYATLKEAWRSTRGRMEILARHRQWFKSDASFTYAAGPVVAWGIRRLLGQQILAVMRNAKANRGVDKKRR